ncbi:transporter [Shewanella mesophila]|nr:transporter [Shewanella mesophila]
MLLVTVLLPNFVYSQDLEPRSYTNIPIDMNFLATGYLHSEGEVSPSPGVLLEDAQLNINTAAIAYVRSFELAGSSAKVDLAVARSCFEGSAISNGERIEADNCGYNDPTFKLTWNFFGAPAMKATEFSTWRQGVVVGTSLEVTAPIGSYNVDKLLNASANRWVLRPGIGMSQKFGDWYYNLIASVRLYGDNDEYQGKGALAQEPQYTLQAHLIYIIDPGHWISLNSNYFFGGETIKNGVNSNDKQDNSRFGLTYSIALNHSHSIKLNYSTGVLTRFGNDFDSLGAFWMYRF